MKHLLLVWYASKQSFLISVYFRRVCPSRKSNTFIRLCPSLSWPLYYHLSSVLQCTFMRVCVADNENPFLPLPSKYDRWQTKGRSVFLNFLQGHQMGIIIVYVSGLPGRSTELDLASPCLTHLHDGWPLRQLIGNSLIYSLPLPQSNGFISFYRHMMSQPRSL